MRSRSDEYGDEVYHEEEYDRYDDDSYADRAEDRRFPYLPSWGWGGAWGVMPWASRRDEDEVDYDEGGYDPYGETEVDDEGGFGSLWDESLITLLIVGGAILFFFPEPATSGLGVILMGLGVLAWLVDWAL